MRVSIMKKFKFATNNAWKILIESANFQLSFLSLNWLIHDRAVSQQMEK
jgi:hypothetical protein